MLQDRYSQLAKETVTPAPKGMEFGFSISLRTETDGHKTPGLEATPKTSKIIPITELGKPNTLPITGGNHVSGTKCVVGIGRRKKPTPDCNGLDRGQQYPDPKGCRRAADQSQRT